MFPFFFVKVTTSWEGHLSGAIAGTIAALLFRKKGPQRPEPFKDEEDNEEDIIDDNTASVLTDIPEKQVADTDTKTSPSNGTSITEEKNDGKTKQTGSMI